MEDVMSTPPTRSPSPDEQAAALYVPHRGAISESARVGPVEGADSRETPPPLYDGASIRYLNQGDSGFDEIQAEIDRINDSDSPDDEPPEDDPPDGDLPDSAAGQYEDEEEDTDDLLAA